MARTGHELDVAARRWGDLVRDSLDPPAPPMSVHDGEFWSMWTRHHARIRATVARRVRDASAVDDIVQDTYLRAARGWSQLRSPERAPAWLARVAANVVADHFRQRRPLTTAREPAAPEDADVLAWAAQCLPAMLDELPEPFRDALRLDLAGVTQREIARTSGISVSGAKSRVQRGRARLRERYLACCDVEVGAHGIVDVTPRPPVPSSS